MQQQDMPSTPPRPVPTYANDEDPPNDIREQRRAAVFEQRERRPIRPRILFPQAPHRLILRERWWISMNNMVQSFWLLSLILAQQPSITENETPIRCPLALSMPRRWLTTPNTTAPNRLFWLLTVTKPTIPVVSFLFRQTKVFDWNTKSRLWSDYSLCPLCARFPLCFYDLWSTLSLWHLLVSVYVKCYECTVYKIAADCSFRLRDIVSKLLGSDMGTTR